MRKIVFILALFFSSTCSVNAQQKEYIYKDSALKELAPAPLEETTTESNTVNQEAEDKPDTLLYYYPSEIIADTIVAWKKGKAFAYANYLDSLLKEAKNKKKDPPPSFNMPRQSWMEQLFSSAIVKVIFWILAGIFVAFIVYRLFLADSIFQKNVKKAEAVFEAVREEEITSETDFDAAITMAISQQQYRTAVRYHYLKTLHMLAAHQWILLSGDKTNFQYVREIKHIELQNGFSKLTLHYEYVWYGEFPIDAIQYARMEMDFKEFDKKL